MFVDSSCFYGDLRESITLQICDHTGQWRSLCSKFWSSENNIVICRQLLNQNSENEKGTYNCFDHNYYNTNLPTTLLLTHTYTHTCIPNIHTHTNTHTHSG